MKTTTNQNYEWPYITGLVCIAASFIVYLLGNHHSNDYNFFSQLFLFNYAFSIGYFILLLIQRSRYDNPKPPFSYPCLINLVILLTISAFSLNSEMRVFARFPAWLNVYTLLSIPLFLAFPYFKNVPAFCKAILFFLSGASLILSLYMFLFLIPLLPISCIGLLALGISIHSFVPAMWLLILYGFIIKTKSSAKLKLYVIAGALLPLILLVVYLNKWYSLQTEIKETIAELNIKLDHQLPEPIYLAQKLPNDALTEEILMARFKAQRFWDDGFGMINGSIQKYHNPLSTIASMLFDDIGLDDKTVTTILNIRKDFRHVNTRKLWSGTSLSTMAISTNVQVFPEYRLAYHEKIINIHNNPEDVSDDNWFVEKTQEALYTFHVPEGSIVTSLSLWINGKEQKSRLSTLQKADSAYTKIVGAERRDPAVVHWKEGNKVTVNVFPCTENEDRKFKIGFTTPLKVESNKLLLENIWFEGPESKDAKEVTQIILAGETNAPVTLPDGFELNANGNYIYKGSYRPYWQLELAKKSLSANAFCFGGFKYTMQEALPQKTYEPVKDVFLDITDQWTREEFDQLITQLGSKNIYTWLPEKTKITNQNKNLVWKSVCEDQFSIPFIYDITDPASAVIITKTSYRSPVLEELTKSDIAANYTTWLTGHSKKIKVLNIGTELSPWWRSLRELRLLNYEACNTDEAIRKTLKGTWNRFTEDTGRIVIYNSHLAITKTPVDSLATGNAPDHLLRIFNYNDVLRKVGSTYFEKEKYEDALFSEAEEAYVVSPVTSMIVLENDADYDRMGIAKNKNTVGNAGVIGGGAVPEPHEWLLIGFVVFIILRHLTKRKQVAI